MDSPDSGQRSRYPILLLAPLLPHWLLQEALASESHPLLDSPITPITKVNQSNIHCSRNVFQVPTRCCMGHGGKQKCVSAPWNLAQQKPRLMELAPKCNPSLCSPLASTMATPLARPQPTSHSMLQPGESWKFHQILPPTPRTQESVPAVLE